MIKLSDYIFESKEVSTLSNKERKNEIIKYLKHKKYDDYVETLNDMLKDPKSKALLEDGFGGILGDTKLNFSIKKIPVSQLMPSQREINPNKSILHALQSDKIFLQSFTDPIEIKKPIVTFRENYVIDGHHAWFQALVFNPEGKILAFNYDGDISPIQMLKAVQGTIAAVKAAENDNNGDLPSQRIGKINVFDDNFDKKKIKEYLEDNLNKDLIPLYNKYIDKCKDFDTTIEYLTERILDIKANNYPSDTAPQRKNMPQLFSAGTNAKDKKTSYPYIKGSAMNKLKDDKFVKNAVR